MNQQYFEGAVKWLSRLTFVARQCSRRGGELEVTLYSDGARVELSGRAPVVLRGTITF